MKKNKMTLKWVSKVLVNSEINPDDYYNTLNTNEQMKKHVVAFRSSNHRIRTVRNAHIALSRSLR